MRHNLITTFVQTRWPIYLALFAALSSCQEEENLINLPPDDAAITVASPVAQLLLRVASLDGSADNVLDKSSCLTIILPVTVIAGGETIVVNTPADYEVVEEALDNDDDGEVEFLFPIEVKLPNHTRITISSNTQLESRIEQCEDEDDFECIDIVYPITIRVYDTNNQISNVITLVDDEALYQFIQQLVEGTYISIAFPITLVTQENPVLIINNYDELAAAILLSEDDCDDDDGSDPEFIQTLLSGDWSVDSFVDEGDDQTDDWEGFVLTFSADGTLTATDGNTILTGSWQAETDDGELELTVQLITGNPFDDMNEDWTVVSYSSETIELEDVDDDVPAELKTLILKKI